MLLEVLTRTMGNRPQMLARNTASLQRQSDPDWAQSLLVDVVGVGVAASHRLLADHEPRGEWVWCLDDDDECIYPELVADVRRIAAEQPAAGCIFVRMDHGPLGVLPDAATWGGPPVHGHIGISAYIVRREVWMTHRHAWLSLRYQSDYDFIRTVYALESWVRGGIVWHDVVASRVQRISHGAAEFAVDLPREYR